MSCLCMVDPFFERFKDGTIRKIARKGSLNKFMFFTKILLTDGKQELEFEIVKRTHYNNNNKLFHLEHLLCEFSDSNIWSTLNHFKHIVVFEIENK